MPGQDTANAVRDSIYKACLHKDDMEWEKWLR